jgi:hypothetical protein
VSANTSVGDICDQMRKIYSSFQKGTKVTKVMLRVAPDTVRTAAGYIVVYRYSDHFVDAVSALNERIGRVIPVIRYGPHNVHTTITSFHDAASDKDNRWSSKTIAAIQRSVVMVSPELWRGVKIDFRDWLVKDGTVVAAGYPNRKFGVAALTLRNAGFLNEIDLRLPRIAHVTVARMCAMGHPGAAVTLRKIFRSTPPLGAVQPVRIDVAFYQSGPQGFDLIPHCTLFNRTEP